MHAAQHIATYLRGDKTADIVLLQKFGVRHHEAVNAGQCTWVCVGWYCRGRGVLLLEYAPPSQILTKH